MGRRSGAREPDSGHRLRVRQRRRLPHGLSGYRVAQAAVAGGRRSSGQFALMVIEGARADRALIRHERVGGYWRSSKTTAESWSNGWLSKARQTGTAWSTLISKAFFSAAAMWCRKCVQTRD